MTEAPQLVLASRNLGKLAEFRRLLAPYPWTLVSLDDVGFVGDVDEPGPGYVDNARAKAETITAATGRAAFADDSGIEVIALNGWPGPHSARWLGAGASDVDRLHGLIAEVDRQCPTDRRCQYVAVVAVSRPGAATALARGSCAGTLVAPIGGGGFGYDPAFLSGDLGIRFSEATAEQKDAVSHRGRAVAALAAGGGLEVGVSGGGSRNRCPETPQLANRHSSGVESSSKIK